MNDMHTIGVVLQFLCMFYLSDGMNTNDDDDNLYANYFNYDELAPQISFMGDQNLSNANIEGNHLATKSINEPSLATSNSNMNISFSGNNDRTETKRKRERKSRGKQQLTQVVHTDMANFRQVVQHLTSAPEWRRPIHTHAASIGGLLNMHDGPLNHSLTAPNQQNNGQLNHSLTAPNQQNNGQLNHSLTAPNQQNNGQLNHSLTAPKQQNNGQVNHSLAAPNQSRTAPYKSPSQALDGAAFQYEGHSFPILESSRPFDDITKQ